MLVAKQTPFGRKLCWAQGVLIVSVLIAYLAAIIELGNNLEVELSSTANGCDGKDILVMKESLRRYKWSPERLDKYEVDFEKQMVNLLNQSTTEECFVVDSSCRPNAQVMQKQSTDVPWMIIAAVFVWGLLKFTFLDIRIARAILGCFQAMCCFWTVMIWDESSSQAEEETREEHAEKSADDVLPILMAFAPHWKCNKGELVVGKCNGKFKGGMWAVNKVWSYLRYKLAPNVVLAILTTAQWHTDCEHVLIISGSNHVTFMGGLLLFHLWIFSTACWFYSKRYSQCAHVKEADERGYVYSYIGKLPAGSSHSQYCGQAWNTGMLHMMVCDVLIVYQWMAYSATHNLNLLFIINFELRFDLSFSVSSLQLLTSLLSMLEMVGFVQFLLLKDDEKQGSSSESSRESSSESSGEPAIDVERAENAPVEPPSDQPQLTIEVANAHKEAAHGDNATSEPALQPHASRSISQGTPDVCDGCRMAGWLDGWIAGWLGASDAKKTDRPGLTSDIDEVVLQTANPDAAAPSSQTTGKA